MKRILVALLALLVLTGAASAQAAAAEKPYDSALVKKYMGEIMAGTGRIRSALAGKDFVQIQASFARLEEIALDLQPMKPRRGKAEDWKELWVEFAKEAAAGKKAATDKDADKSKLALDAIMKAQMRGHGSFK